MSSQRCGKCRGTGHNRLTCGKSAPTPARGPQRPVLASANPQAAGGNSFGAAAAEDPYTYVYTNFRTRQESVAAPAGTAVDAQPEAPPPHCGCGARGSIPTSRSGFSPMSMGSRQGMQTSGQRCTETMPCWIVSESFRSSSAGVLPGNCGRRRNCSDMSRFIRRAGQLRVTLLRRLWAGQLHRTSSLCTAPDGNQTTNT